MAREGEAGRRSNRVQGSEATRELKLVDDPNRCQNSMWMKVRGKFRVLALALENTRRVQWIDLLAYLTIKQSFHVYANSPTLLFFILDMSNNERTAKHPMGILSKGGLPPLLIPLPKPKFPLASISAPNPISDPFLALYTARRSTYLTYLTYRCSI